MSYVLIYGGIRLDLDQGAMRELGLRPGQKVPDDQVVACMKAQARQVCLSHPDAKAPLIDDLAAWAFDEEDAAERSSRPN